MAKLFQGSSGMWAGILDDPDPRVFKNDASGTCRDFAGSRSSNFLEREHNIEMIKQYTGNMESRTCNVKRDVLVEYPPVDTESLYARIRRMIKGKTSRHNDAAKAVLQQWLDDHSIAAYPSKDEKEDLAAKTGLSAEQVSIFFRNARSRWSPPLENWLSSPPAAEPAAPEAILKAINSSPPLQGRTTLLITFLRSLRREGFRSEEIAT
jgi:hypothetical protein